MSYISLFSGIGGLESSRESPSLFCEIDASCARVLTRMHPSVPVVADVTTLRPPSADVVAGGWPCQDVSVAGKRAGLAGYRSGLVRDLIRVAVESGAHSIVAENVSNLFVLRNGTEFEEALRLLKEAGFPHIAWRVLNAREFGLPQHRERVLIVASKYEAVAWSLHQGLPEVSLSTESPWFAAGFYWTAGLQSLSYRVGVAPTLKVGSSLSISSPPAVEMGDIVRKLSPSECLRLQGFEPGLFAGLTDAEIYRMAGNAVPVPMGSFAVDAVLDPRRPDGVATSFGVLRKNGVLIDGMPYEVEHSKRQFASNLGDFVEPAGKPLSQRAAAGLLSRLERSGKPCPPSLRVKLEAIASQEPVPRVA